MPISLRLTKSGKTLLIAQGKEEKDTLERFPYHLQMFGDQVQVVTALLVSTPLSDQVVEIVKTLTAVLTDWEETRPDWNQVFYALQVKNGSMTLEQVVDLERAERGEDVSKLLEGVDIWECKELSNDYYGRLEAIIDTIEFLGGYVNTDAIRFGVKLLYPHITFQGSFIRLLGDLKRQKRVFLIGDGRYVLFEKLPEDLKRLLQL